MTSSLPLLAGATLVAGLTGMALNGATITQHGQQVTTTAVQPAPPAGGGAVTVRPDRLAQDGPAVDRSAGGGRGGRGGREHRQGDTATPRRGADVVEHMAAREPSDQRRVADYWTPRRMAGAVPIDLLGTVTGALGTASRALDGAGVHLPGGSAAPPRRTAGAAAPGPLTSVTGALGGVSSPALRNARTSGARWDSGGWVARTTGRVFLTIDGIDFVCSASSVRSANRDLVVTAGHCVKDGTGAWADNWTFVPGYDRGRQPYGQFTARRMFVAGPWAREADDSYDVGMVAVNQRDGRHLAEVAGAQDIAFGVARGRQTHGFGFPADAPYDGERLVYCAGPVRDDPHGQTADQGLRCDMTAGSSGGPWLSGFDPATGRGTVTSVSSFKYSDDRGTMYGPYFGETARRLYTASERS